MFAATWICFVLAGLAGLAALVYTVLTPAACSWFMVVVTGGSANGSSTSGYAAVCLSAPGSWWINHWGNGSISFAAGTLTLNGFLYVGPPPTPNTRPPVAEPAGSA